MRFNALAHKFKYRSPLWIESDSSSKSSSDRNSGLCASDDSIRGASSDSSTSINNYLDSKVWCLHYLDNFRSPLLIESDSSSKTSTDRNTRLCDSKVQSLNYLSISPLKSTLQLPAISLKVLA